MAQNAPNKVIFASFSSFAGKTLQTSRETRLKKEQTHSVKLSSDITNPLIKKRNKQEFLLIPL
jgi:hypothetical protein